MTDDEGMTKPEDSGHCEGSFWFDKEAPHVREEPDRKPAYDLEERTARFGEAIIDFAKNIAAGPLTERIISQLVGAGTSVGANYDEAVDAVSKKEFLKCIVTCKKEARESKDFLRMAARRSRTEVRSARAMARSQSAAPDFLQNLEEREREMMKYEALVLRPSSFVLNSSFVIRHSSF